MEPRSKYPVWHVLKVLLWCTLKDVAPWLLYERLQSQKGFRQRQGLPTELISGGRSHRHPDPRFVLLGPQAPAAAAPAGGGGPATCLKEATHADPDAGPGPTALPRGVRPEEGGAEVPRQDDDARPRDGRRQGQG